MALIRKGNDNLTVSTTPSSSSGSKRKRIVLEEDEFIETIDKIIERDFFPDIYKMKQQLKQYSTQLVNDTTSLNTINSFEPTPSTFETPSIRGYCDTPRPREDVTQPINPNQQEVKKIKDNLTLNAFLSNYTSEDNASFDDIMEEAEKRHRSKYPWLYLNESEVNKSVEDSLALPSIEKQAEIEANEDKKPLTWPYKNLNSIMFIPDGVTEKSLTNKGPTVCHENTRFNKNPFNDNLNEAILAEAALIHSKEKEGRIGIDGKEMLSSDGPRIGGYGFVSMTPSPVPGVTNTPLMTWGQIEGTPYSLDGGETPLIHSSSLPPGTPQFRIPDVPERDRIGHALADKMTRQNRDKKKEALKQAQYLRNSPLITSGGKTLSESLGTMSPAAQKLATLKLGINKYADKKLRESYSPCISTTPDSRISTPTPPAKRILNTPKSTADTSLTDNLLVIPRKSGKS